MRVHLRNVVHTAIERGLVVGHHRVSKLPKPQQKDMDAVVDTMMKSVWESLDGIIDFRDEEHDHHEHGEDERARSIGFQSVDAVSNETLTPELDDEDIIPLDTLHRIRR
jgi:fructose-1,6-bisphosphatase